LYDSIITEPCKQYYQDARKGHSKTVGRPVVEVDVAPVVVVVVVVAAGNRTPKVTHLLKRHRSACTTAS